LLKKYEYSIHFKWLMNPLNCQHLGSDTI
jgi:hypothetical protein